MDNLPHKTLDLDEFFAMGPVIRVTPEDNQDIEDIAQFWKKFQNEDILSKIPHKTNLDIIAVYFDYESSHLEPYSLMLGAIVSDIDKVPAGMEALTIPPSRYAVFDVDFKIPDPVMTTWENIWNQDIGRTFNYDFEIYEEKLKHASICVSIR